jgi:hypothetical protein
MATESLHGPLKRYRKIDEGIICPVFATPIREEK